MQIACAAFPVRMCVANEGVGVALAGPKEMATSFVVEEKKCDLLPEVEQGEGGK